MRSMIVTLTCLVLVSLISSPARSLDQIGVYADPTGANCNIEFTTGGLQPFYVVHMSSSGARGIGFAAPKPTCLIEASWVLDQSPHTIMNGNSQVGTTVSYGSCITGPIHSLTIWYTSTGLGTPPCCVYNVIADPSTASGRIEATNCDDATVFVLGASNTVNGNPSCPCGVVPTRPRTWGQIKALYR